MLLKRAVEEARDYARAKLIYKSSNKWRLSSDKIRHSDDALMYKDKVRRFYSNEIDRLTARVLNSEDEYTAKTEFNKFDAKLHDLYAAWKIGNCGEYALIALGYITKKFPNVVAQTVTLEDEGDHAFVAAGWRALLGSELERGRDIADWKGIWICDPWANIACSAQDYKSEFKNKMAKWNKVNKLVLYNGEWIDPSGDPYIKTLDCPKKVTGWRGAAPTIE